MTQQEPPCQRCECPADCHEADEEDVRGACASCDCDHYVGPGHERDDEPPEFEPYDGLCEYEKIGRGQ